MKKPTAATKSKTKSAPAAKKQVKPSAPAKKSAPAPKKKAPVTPAVAKPAASKKKAEPKRIAPAEMIAPEAIVTAVAAEPTVPIVPEPPVQPVTVTESAPVVEKTAEATPAPASKTKGKPKKEKDTPAILPPAAAEVPKPAEEPKPVKAVPAVKPLVCLLGDELFVKDFSAFFQAHNIPVIELKNLGTLKTNAKKITAAFELTLLPSEVKTKNLRALDETLPAHVPVAVNSITATVLQQTHGLATRERFIGIGAFPTLTEHALFELAPSLHTTKATLDAMEALLASAKKETALVQDGVGMVMPRILCQIINEALFTVQADVATPQDIDEAMKHGTNYPAGPIAWGERIGFGTVAAVLDSLYAYYQEERYRTAPLLKQMAVAGIFWKTAQEKTQNGNS